MNGITSLFNTQRVTSRKNFQMDQLHIFHVNALVNEIFLTIYIIEHHHKKPVSTPIGFVPNVMMTGNKYLSSL